jgi:hypothetical protein
MNVARTTPRPLSFTHPTRMTRIAGTDHRHYASITRRPLNKRGYVASIIVNGCGTFDKSFDCQGDAIEWLQREGFTRDR